MSLDNFSEIHWKLLEMLQDPKKWLSDHELPESLRSQNLRGLILATFPEAESQWESYESAFNELTTQKLVDAGNPHIHMTIPGIMGKHTTEEGDELLSRR